MNVVVTRCRAISSSATSASNFGSRTTVEPRTWCSAEKNATAREVARHDDQASASEPVGDLRASDGVERHPRDTVAVAAAARGEGVGDPARFPVEGCEVKGAIGADDGGIGRQRSGVARQEI